MAEYKQPKYNDQKTDILRVLRKKAGLSQKQAAEILGVYRTTLSEWETGQRRAVRTPRWKLIAYLSDTLRLRGNPDKFIEVWNQVMVEEWRWEPLSLEEKGQYLYDATNPTVEVEATVSTSLSKVATPSEVHEIPEKISPPAPPQQAQAKIVPLQRPPLVKYFTGREKEGKELIKNLQPGKVVALWGHTGIGKTQIVSKVMQKLTPGDESPEQFPDGIISYSFYGEGQHRAEVALEEIARAFNIKPEANRPPAMRAKQALARKKVLLYLDGAENADNLAKVMEATDSRNNCVLFTTTDEDQAKQHSDTDTEIDAPPLNESTSLLQELSKPYLMAKSTAHRIYDLVGGLTLALDLAGRRFAKVKTDEEAEDYLDWLENLPFEQLSLEERRLGSVEALIRYNLNLLSEAARLVMATAGILAFAPFSSQVVAEALAVSEIEILAPLWELENYSLLIKTGDRFEVKHNLVHKFASEKLKPPKEMVKRLATYYTGLAEEQSELGVEGFARLDPERGHIMAVLKDCVKRKNWKITYDLVLAINDYLKLQGHWVDRIASVMSSLEATRALKDRYREQITLVELGRAYRDLGQAKQAIEYYQQALAIAKEIGDREREADTLTELGTTYRNLGRAEEAINSYEQALTFAREVGSSQGLILGNLGLAYSDLGLLDKSIEYHNQALTIAQQVEDRIDEVNQLGNLGTAYRDLGQDERAAAYFQQQLTIAQEIGDRDSEGYALANLGSLSFYNQEQAEQRIADNEQALTISREIGSQRLEGIALTNRDVVINLSGPYEGLNLFAQRQTILKLIKEDKLIK